MIDNIKRDPFEKNVLDNNSALAIGGALAGPTTAYLYDWNLLPIGQQMWLKELSTYKKFPSLQAPASYNLDQVIAAMQEAKYTSHMGE
jgi:arylsulfatase